MSNLSQTALEYIDADLSVIPVGDDKRPYKGLKWDDFKTRQMTGDEVRKHFSNGAHGIAVVCGAVSGGLECIDFDAHNKNIKSVYKKWGSDQGVKDILTRNKVYIEKSQRGGFHVFYRYEADEYQGSNPKIAKWEDGDSMIETKAEGGYVIVAPSPKYTPVLNSIIDVSTLTREERDYLLAKAAEHNQYTRNNDTSTDEVPDDDAPEQPGHHYTDPISWFNWNKAGYAKKLLESKGWSRISIDKKSGIESWRRPEKDDGTSATWGNKHNAFYVFSSSASPFEANCYYTPFQIVTLLRYKGQYQKSIGWLIAKYFPYELSYIRVGVDYYKKIRKQDRFGITRTELKAWSKEEIKQDYGPNALNDIPRYDDFAIVPDNFNYNPVIDNCYNLYKEFAHKPVKGDWPWTEILLHHVFGDQFKLGIRYLQALYLHPDRMLPILVLVSRERQTGKTTFLNWLNQIFGDNMANITPEDLTGAFNYVYATSNIIAIEETLFEKAMSVEKMKALATGKFISVNMKFVSQFKVPFFGKIILASNNEDKFARIDEEEIRFWIRKLPKPKMANHSIESELVKEIPAFLYYLTTLDPIDWELDRSGFTPEELSNDVLEAVKEESHSSLYKDLRELITDWFNNCTANNLMVIPADIKNKWFPNNSRVDINYIRYVIKHEFKMVPQSNRKYSPFDEYENSLAVRTGTPYKFFRDDFYTKTDEEK